MHASTAGRSPPYREVLRRFSLKHRVLFLLRVDNNDFKRVHDTISRFLEAACSGDISTIDRLLKKPWIDGSVRTRAFKKACEFGHIEVVERLLKEQGVVPNAQFDWAIRIAAANNHSALVDRLLNIDLIDATARNNWALVRAAERGHARIVERLLSVPGIDPGARNNWSIIKAAENGHAEIVNLLLRVPGVDPTALDNEALKSAIRLGWSDIVCALIQDDRIRGTITNFGNIFHVASRAAIRRKLLAAMRENAVKTILLWAWARNPIPDNLRQMILLYAHGIWLPGASEDENLNIIRSIMRRGRLGRAITNDHQKRYSLPQEHP